LYALSQLNKWVKQIVFYVCMYWFNLVKVCVTVSPSNDEILVIFDFDLSESFFYFCDNKVACNLKTTIQILMQFYTATYITRFCKINKRGLISSWPLTLRAEIDKITLPSDIAYIRLLRYGYEMKWYCVGSGNASSSRWRLDHNSATFRPWNFSFAYGSWWRHAASSTASLPSSSSTPSRSLWRYLPSAVLGWLVA